MKQILCEMCDGTNFTKEEGMFVCQDCGMKYSVEEAKKLMVETADGPAKGAAHTDKINNMLTLAENAVNQGNNAQAEEYANKVLELDSTVAYAWLIKGKAVGWQSTLTNIRFSEMASCFSQALSCVEAEKIDAYKQVMAEQASSISKAFLTLTTGNFGKYPSKDNLTNINQAISSMLTLNLDMIKMMIFMDMESVYHHFSLKMNEAAVAGASMADNEFGPDNSDRTKYAWELFLDRSDCCIKLLELALPLCDDITRVDRINKNYEILMNNIINSCSYRFEASGYGSRYVKHYTLTSEAVNSRKNLVRAFDQKAKNRINDIKEKQRKKAEEERKKQEEEQRQKNEAYWAEHAEEKKALESEKEQLQKKVATYEKELKEIEDKNAPEKIRLEKEKKAVLPEEQAANEQKDLIHDLYVRRDSLGIFKGKEKKAITTQIDDVENPKYEQLKAVADKARKELDDKVRDRLSVLNDEGKQQRNEMKACKARIDEITKELTKNR